MNKAFAIIAALAVVILLILISVKAVNKPQDIQLAGLNNITSTESPEDNESRAVLAFAETEHDFGIIKQSGGIVQHEFPFTYNGEVPINVIGVPTSCQCTSAEISKSELAPGDSAVITVYFDPNLHEEPEGKFFKTITLRTEPEVEDNPELKIWAEIDLDLGPEAYKLKFHND